MLNFIEEHCDNGEKRWLRTVINTYSIECSAVLLFLTAIIQLRPKRIISGILVNTFILFGSSSMRLCASMKL